MTRSLIPCIVLISALAAAAAQPFWQHLRRWMAHICPIIAAAVLSLCVWELITTGWTVRSGKVWTTDAPYRETSVQLKKWAGEGVLAVEMQAASLFAFGIARQASVASVAMVSNAVDHSGKQFDTGSQEDGLRVLEGIARAGCSFLAPL